MAEPPSDEGAVHAITIWALPRVPVTVWGAVGAPNGVTAADGDDVADEPRAFTAATEKVYEVVVVRPTTLAVRAAVVTDVQPGVQVTTYDVIARPPSLAGADQLTVAVPEPEREADGAVGVAGTVKGTTVVEGSLATLPSA